MDESVLWQISYGMYAVSTLDGERPVGCVVNTVTQITAENPVFALSMNKDNFTHDCIRKTGAFSVSVLSEQTPALAIGVLGFQSAREQNKFDKLEWESRDGLPIVREHSSSYLTFDVLSFVEAETHSIILARLRDAQKLESLPPMTYEYYHKVVKGKAPKNAPTYQAQKSAKYVCDTCGYVYDGDIKNMPDDFQCPICGMDKSHFLKK